MSYKKGRSFEYRVKYFFQKHGFHVIRSAGSHSPTDLIIKKGDKSYHIQCKNDKSYINNKLIKSILDNVLSGYIYQINDSIFMFNRDILLKILDNSHINKDYVQMDYKEIKILKKIIDYLNVNDFVIINIPRKKSWLICSKIIKN